jgi:hypothetical protein
MILSHTIYRQQIPPSLAECEAIGRYSYRIRELEISDQFSLWFLQSTSFGQLSLPNLRLLKWEMHNIIYIQPLLSPSIVALDVRVEGDNDATLLSFLQNYPLLCPNLRSVKFDLTGAHGIRNDPDTLIHAMSMAIANHKSLECLVLTTPTDDVVLEQLLMSPTLKVLSLTGRAGSQNLFLNDISIPPTDTPLRNVRDLLLAISSLSVITSLLRPRDQVFRTIHLHISFPPMPEAVQEFSTALATHQREDSLQSIVLDHLNDSPGGAVGRSDVMREIGHHYCLSFDAFRPLMFLGRLRELVIHLLNGISLDNDELAMMAGSWPLLEVLKLAPLLSRWGPWPMPKSVTFSGLSILLTSCPKLRELDLPLDAREVPEHAPSDPCNTAIESLRLSGCPISDPNRVARFLRTQLPSVSSVVGPYDPTEYGDLWKKVDANLRGWTGR